MNMHKHTHICNFTASGGASEINNNISQDVNNRCFKNIFLDGFLGQTHQKLVCVSVCVVCQASLCVLYMWKENQASNSDRERFDTCSQITTWSQEGIHMSPSIIQHPSIILNLLYRSVVESIPEHIRQKGENMSWTHHQCTTGHTYHLLLHLDSI